MIHQSQRLALGLKACNHALSVHARLNNFQGDPTTDRLFLFGHENNPATTFPNLLEQLVPIHPVARLLPNRSFSSPFAYHLWWLFQEISGPVIGPEPSLYSVTQILVFSASPVQKGDPLLNRKLNRFRENFDVASRVTRHGLPSISFSSQARENVQ
jgi:hypothetical protein